MHLPPRAALLYVRNELIARFALSPTALAGILAGSSGWRAWVALRFRSSAWSVTFGCGAWPVTIGRASAIKSIARSPFAGIALLLASIGIYRVLAYLTGQRMPEIGVRMTLGATARDVMDRSGCSRRSRAPASRPGDAAVYLAAFAIMTPVLLTAALSAGLVPALRASRVDPVSALRQE